MKVSPSGIMRLGRKGKLNPRYTRGFEILERVVKVAHRIPSPSNLSSVDNVSHMSMLRNYDPNPSHVLDYEPIKLIEDLTYAE